ncbi:hypothetical protein KCU67_g860, partial [Aureobasidium melanogenum]
MLRAAGTTDYRTLISSTKGLKAATAWFLQQGLLAQFEVAREMAAGVVLGPGQEAQDLADGLPDARLDDRREDLPGDLPDGTMAGLAGRLADRPTNN